MMAKKTDDITIYNSRAKIAIGLFKPAIILLVTVIFYLQLHFKETYANWIVGSIGFLIIAACFYRFFSGTIYLIKMKKNYLLLTPSGLTEVSVFYPPVTIQWQDIIKLEMVAGFDRLLLTTRSPLGKIKTNQYSLLIPGKITKKAARGPYQVILNAKYLAPTSKNLGLEFARFLPQDKISAL